MFDVTPRVSRSRPIAAVVCIAVLGAALLAGCSSQSVSSGAGGSGGMVGNSYASQLVQLDPTTLQITTRKRVTGDLDEVTKPGTTTYKALAQVIASAKLRAALESKNLGYRYFLVQGVQNQSRTIEERSSQSGAIPESGFSFAPGHYGNDVELIIQATVKLWGKADDPATQNATPPENAYDVDKVLADAGLGQANAAAATPASATH